MKRLQTVTVAFSALLCLSPLAQAQRGQPKPAGRTALFVMLENGGVKANFAQCKKGLKIPQIPVASCGKLELCLQPGESPAQMLGRIGKLLANNRACANPARWSMRTVTFDAWFEKASDYLLEEVTKAIQSLQNTRGAYDRVVVLEDKYLTPTNALRAMRQLASQGYTLDVHVLVHGGNEVFIGYRNNRFDDKTFFAPAKKIPGLRLRSVYQMNCVSGTLIDNWLALGAKVVNGTLGKKNNYMPQSYFHFTGLWLRGVPFGSAVARSYADARVYTEPVYRIGRSASYVTDSKMQVQGQANLRLQIAAAPSNRVGRVINRGRKTAETAAKKTAAAVAAGYKAAKKTAAQAAKLLRDAGYSTKECALALRQQFGCSARQVAKYLRQAGCSTNAVADVLKSELKCSAKQIAQSLKYAGCSATTIARTLKSRLKCSTSQIASYMKAAGCSFSQTAKAIWANSAKKLSSFNSLVSAMMKQWNQANLQVIGNLAKIGIKA